MIGRSVSADATLAGTVTGAKATALRWWAVRVEPLTESGDDGFGPRDKSYVGLHTPDTDAVEISY